VLHVLSFESAVSHFNAHCSEFFLLITPRTKQDLERALA